MNEIPKSVADHQQLLRTAFDAYLEQLNRGGLEPTESYLPYDFEEAIDARYWNFGKTNVLVEDELRDLTNELNRWHEALLRWHTWNQVVQHYNKKEAWILRREFLEPLVFYCLFQPSSSRDRFTFVVTNAMHQVRLMIEKGYKDFLTGDPKTPNEVTKPNYLSRRKKENRLSNLISIWQEGKDFMAFHGTVDDEAYKKETANYRNLHSHIIGPRLESGHVQTVVRIVKPQTTFIRQADGTYIENPTGKVVPTYGFGGGIPPLDLEKAHAANLEQHRRARKCYESYRKLLATGLEAMPLASQPQIKQVEEE